MKKYLALLLLLIPLSIGIVSTIQDRYDFGRTVALQLLCLTITAGMIVWNRSTQRSDWFLPLAYVFCIVGDAFLFHRGDNPYLFVLGIAMFGLTHLSYFSLMLSNGRIHTRFGAALTSTLLLYYAVCLLPLNDMVWPLKLAVLIYLLLSCLTLSAAVGSRLPHPEKALFILALSLMLVSDTTISFKEFLRWEKLNILLMPTYYFSLIFMCVALCVKLRRGANPQRSSSAGLTGGAEVEALRHEA